ncbi:type III secretion system translocon subunit SctE [Vibrio sagamiensis]|uniref:Translocator protein BipB-like C-terminal domain-containing protein n=1 Tax=Vibrio sagamiensis NBRC 104589 TaxID=1219064 RepID=A0A511QDU8_9VIBR|nr:type III secretion system translocon subunit SctE [Vibrio sagamiensis]PNQ54562.1 hypothetical protein C1141_15230 [Vibrio agarivorans]GEM75470.1 hypothetical protein VSA01S_15820 [Vibrio sagamiensis NBRC 104589]
MTSITTFNRAQILPSVNYGLDSSESVSNSEGNSSAVIDEFQSKTFSPQPLSNDRVQLNKPNAEMVNKAIAFPEVTSQEMERAQKIANTQDNNVKLFTSHILDSVDSLLSGKSKAVNFELAFTLLLNKIGNLQRDLTVDKLNATKSTYEDDMVENQKKIKEAEKAALEAKQVGKASSVLGWLGAAASLVVGVALAATGVGLIAIAAGAAMAVGGFVELTQKVINLPVVKDAFVSTFGEDAFNGLNTALTVVGVTCAVASVLITGGGSAAKLMTNLGSKLGVDMLTTAGSKLTNLITSLESVGAKSIAVTSHATNYVASGSSLALDTSKGITDITHYAKQIQMNYMEADIAEFKAKLAGLDATLENLRDELIKTTERNSELISNMMRTMNSNVESLNKLNQNYI